MIVTISREFGSGAVEIGRIVAARCGLRLYVDELPHAVADRLGVAPEELLNDEDAAPSFFARVVRQLPGSVIDPAAVPDVEDFEAELNVRRRIEFSLKHAADGIEAVILGRAAGHVLGPRPDVVRVFLHAPLAWRVERLVTLFGYAPAVAEATARRVDAARARYVREYYDAVWGDARCYDVALDTSRASIADSAETLIAAVVARYTPQ